MCLTGIRSLVAIPTKLFNIIIMSAEAGRDIAIQTYSTVENSKYLSKKVLAQGEHTLKFLSPTYLLPSKNYKI